jgi:hypothetical protein
MAMPHAWIARVMAGVPHADSAAVPASVYRVLLPHENHRLTIRQHPAVLVGPALLVIGWFIGALIAGWVLPDKINYPPTFIIWGAWLFIVARLIIRVYGWMESYLVFSDLRLFAVSGGLFRNVQAIPLSVMSDVSFSKSQVGKIIDYGKFIVEVGGADRVHIPIDYVPYPEEVLVEMRAIIFPAGSADAESRAEAGEP